MLSLPSILSTLDNLLAAARAEDSTPIDDDCPTIHSVDNDPEERDPIIPYDDLDSDEG
jgi:hypothetical protein